jgi:hypothetical protein
LIVVQQALHRHIDADVHARTEDHAFAFQLADALVDQMLFHLEVGDAIAEQAADAIRLLEHCGCMPGACELLGAGEAGRARAHDGDALARAARRELRFHPAFIKGHDPRSRTRSF